MSSLIRSLMVKVGADLTDLKSGMAEAARAMKEGFGNLDLTETNSALKGLNQSVKLTESEFRAATAGMDDWKTNADGLAARTKYLNETLDDQKVILDGLQRKLELTGDKYGEDSKEATNLKIAINNQTAKIKENEAELGKVTSKLDNFGKESDDAAGKTGKLGGALTAAGAFFANLASNAVSAAIGKIKEFAAAAMNSADELMKMSSVTGQSVEQLQKMQYIGDDLGVSLDTLTGAQQKLTKSMGEAEKGSAKYTDAFKKLGVEFKNTDGTLRDSTTVMYEAFEALGKIGNETERDALAMEIFGKSAMDMNPLIEAGADEIKRLGDEAKNSGAIMSEDAVQALDTFGDKLDHVKQSAIASFGEALAGIIGTTKSVAETLSDIELDISGDQQISSLIARYGELTEELKNTNLTEEESAKITAELNQVKQDLIDVSGGVITAAALENGTFGEQLKVLESLTGTRLAYNKYQLESVIYANTGAAAQEKYDDALGRSKKAQENYNAALEAIQESQRHILVGDRQTGGVSWETKLANAQTVAEEFRLELSDVSGELGTLEGNTKDAEDALVYYVQNGMATAEEAAHKFGYSIDEVNTMLADHTDAVEEVSEKEPEIIASFENIGVKVEALATEYAAAKEAARSSVDSQVQLFKDLDTSVAVSIDDVIESMQKQITYLTSYNANLKLAMEKGIDEGLIQTLSDGSLASATILAGLVAGSEQKIDELNDAFRGVEEGKNDFADTVAEMETDFSDKMDEIKGELDEVKDKFNNVDLTDAGRDMVDGYIKGINEGMIELNKVAIRLADEVPDTLRYRMEIESPSKVMARLGEYVDEGYAQGLLGKLHVPESAARRLSDAVRSAASGGIGNLEIGDPLVGGLGADLSASGHIGGDITNTGGISIIVTGNTIANDYDIDRIGNELVRKLKLEGVKI